MVNEANAVLSYWMNDVGPQGWFHPDAAAELKSLEFKELWSRAAAGEMGAWICAPEACLALVVLLDQLPRVMFRGRDDAYASDEVALAVTKRAIVMGHDLKVSEPERQFFYTPLMHSESLMDQERCVRLMSLRLPQADETMLAHIRAHRDIIRQFGRFPYRNAILGRKNTEAEAAYMMAGGYTTSVKAAAAA